MVATRLPSSLVALCHRSAQRFLRWASLKWPSLAISDSRASFLSIFKGDEEQEQEQEQEQEREWVDHSELVVAHASNSNGLVNLFNCITVQLH